MMLTEIIITVIIFRVTLESNDNDDDRDDVNSDGDNVDNDLF